MQKRTRVILAMLAAMLMFISAVPALANPLPPTTGSLTIEKHISNDGLPATGEQLTASPSSPLVNGVQFDLYKVVPAADGTVPDAGSSIYYVINNGALEVYKAVAGSADQLLGTYALISMGSKVTGADSSLGNGLVRWTGLDLGIYLVVENLGASSPTNPAGPAGNVVSIAKACAPFIVSVPMTNAAGDGWIQDVWVYPKNEQMTIDKEVSNDDEAVYVGKEITYKITVSVPTEVKDAQKFVIWDKLDLALDYTAGSVVVTSIKGSARTTLTLNTDYTVTHAPDGSPVTSNKLTISFTSAGCAKLDQCDYVEVTFRTTVNAGILDKPGYAIGNDATAEFTDANGNEVTAETGGGGPEIHLAVIEVFSFDQGTNPLAGAKFKIASSQSNAAAGNFLRIDPNTMIIYDVNDAMWVTLGTANDYEVVANSSVQFVGLRDIIDGTPDQFLSYYIVETQAPAGWNMATSALLVSFDDDPTPAGPLSYDHYARADFHHSRGFTLPVTGDVGTILLTVAGIVLLGGAAIIAISTKKRRPLAEEAEIIVTNG